MRAPPPPATTGPRVMAAATREAVWVLIAATLLAVVMTYPVAFQIDRVGRVNTDDGRWSLWVVSWVAHALTSRPWSVFDANIFHPERLTLAYSEANLLAGAIGAPVWLLTHNPYTTYNVVFLASFVLTFVATYYLVRYLTGSRGSAVVSAILFAFCPYIFARTAHIQLLFIGTLPLVLLQLHRFIDRPLASRAVWLGIALWVAALGCGYYGVFAALMVALGVIWFGLTRRLYLGRDHWIGTTVAAVVSLGLSFPIFLPYIQTADRGFERTLHDIELYSANLPAFAASAAWLHQLWLPYIGHYNEVLFPGLMALGLGGAAAVRSIRRGWLGGVHDVELFYVMVGVVGFWLSLGPGAGLYRILYDYVPVFGFLRAPGRTGVLVTLALSVLSAWVMRDLIGRVRHPAVAITAVSLLAVGDLARAPLTQFRPVPPVSDAYQLLASLPRGPLAEFPFWYQSRDLPRHAQYMLNSTAHWQPLVNGYSDFIPPAFRETMRQLASFPSEESFWLLSERGTRYVTLHLDLYPEDQIDGLLDRLEQHQRRLRPLFRNDSMLLFEVLP